MKKNHWLASCGSSPRLGTLVIWATFTLFSRRVTPTDPPPPCGLVCCIDCFCCGPGTTWSSNSQVCVPDDSSLSGDDDGFCGEVDPSLCYDSLSCTGEDCCGEGTVVDRNPYDPDGERCQCFGEIPFDEEPTLSPTITSSPSPPTYGAEPVTEPSSMPTTAGEECDIDLTGPSCILVDKRRRTFKAKLSAGTALGGTYKWTTLPSAEANRRIKMFGAGSTVLVEGVKVSTIDDDTLLTVEYTTPGGKKCKDSVVFTVVGYEARFRDGSKAGEDKLDDDNSIKETCANAVGEIKEKCDAAGIPTLGHITPGNPAGSTSWAKNIEIRFKLTPCKENSLKKCKFDFERDFQGRAGRVDKNKKFHPSADPPVVFDCPSPKWCDDDRGQSDEDLVLDPPPKCTIFVIDSPGLRLLGANSCITENEIRLVQWNFREWLSVGGELRGSGGDYVLWHASTRVRCKNTDTGLRYVLDEDGVGNRVGKGAYGGNIEDLGAGVTE